MITQLSLFVKFFKHLNILFDGNRYKVNVILLQLNESTLGDQLYFHLFVVGGPSRIKYYFQLA